MLTLAEALEIVEHRAALSPITQESIQRVGDPTGEDALAIVEAEAYRLGMRGLHRYSPELLAESVRDRHLPVVL